MVSEAVPPPPPRDAFLEDDAVDPPKDISGPPFKSNLKRSCCHKEMAHDANKKSEGTRDNSSIRAEKRSIQWVDNHGKQLTEVKEFEASDSDDSDLEKENGLATCSCMIQ